MATNNSINNSLGNASALTIKFANGNGIVDANSMSVLAFTTTANAVNFWTIANSATGGVLQLSAGGTDTNIIVSIVGQGTGGVQIHGTGTNNNAPAGYVGEYMESNIALASAVSLSNNSPANVTSLSLTAGDWNVEGNVWFNIGGTCTAILGWLSLTSATIPDVSLIGEVQNDSTGTALKSQGFVVPTLRVPVNTTTTVYLSAYTLFSTSTVTVCGKIQARRIR